MGAASVCPSAKHNEAAADDAKLASCREAVQHGVDRLMTTPLPLSEACVDAVAQTIMPAADGDDNGDDAEAEGNDNDPTSQNHVISFAKNLSPQEFKEFEQECSLVRPVELRRIFDQAMQISKTPVGKEHFLPPPIVSWHKPGKPQIPSSGGHLANMVRTLPRWREQFRLRGMEALASSSVAVVILAGSTDRRPGRGTPTGIADIGLLSGKSIFQLYAERIVRLKHLATKYLENKRSVVEKDGFHAFTSAAFETQDQAEGTTSAQRGRRGGVFTEQKQPEEEEEKLPDPLVDPSDPANLAAALRRVSISYRQRRRSSIAAGVCPDPSATIPGAPLKKVLLPDPKLHAAPPLGIAEIGGSDSTRNDQHNEKYRPHSVDDHHASRHLLPHSFTQEATFSAVPPERENEEEHVQRPSVPEKDDKELHKDDEGEEEEEGSAEFTSERHNAPKLKHEEMDKDDKKLAMSLSSGRRRQSVAFGGHETIDEFDARKSLATHVQADEGDTSSDEETDSSSEDSEEETDEYVEETVPEMQFADEMKRGWLAERWTKKKRAHGNTAAAQLDKGVRIPLFVMCNEDNEQEIRSFFDLHDFFGLRGEVFIFVQGRMPAVDFKGKVFLEDRQHIAFHPDGGGGVFEALVTQGILSSLRSSLIDHVFMLSQDNVMARIADPVFIGYCMTVRKRAGIKCIERRGLDEQLGICGNRRMQAKWRRGPDGSRVPGKLFLRAAVVEAREAHVDIRDEELANGIKSYTAGSISQYYFHATTISRIARNPRQSWHAVPRRQPHVNTRTGQYVSPPAGDLNSVRLERFVADGIEMIKRGCAGLLVDPDSEWASIRPVEGRDSKYVAVMSLGTLHYQWIVNAGGVFVEGMVPDAGRLRCEVSPLLSYEGEGLSNTFTQNSPLPLPYNLLYASEVQAEDDEYSQKRRVMHNKRYSRAAFQQDEKIGFLRHATLRRVSDAFAVEPTGYMEKCEAKFESLIVNNPENAVWLKNFDTGDVAPSVASSEAELPGTPESLASDRDNWRAKLKIVYDFIDQQNERDKQYMIPELEETLEMDDDPQSKPLDPLRRRGHIAGGDLFALDDKESEDLPSPHGSGGGSPRSRIGTEDSPRSFGVYYVDPFEQAVRERRRPDRQLPRYNALSSMQTRSHMGYQRRFCFDGSMGIGKMTIFGPKSGYTPANKRPRPQALERLRDVQYTSKGFVPREELPSYDPDSPMPDGHKRYQWVIQPPKSRQADSVDMDPRAVLIKSTEPSST